VGILQQKALRGEPEPQGAFVYPFVSQLDIQGSSFEGTGEAERLMLNDMFPTEDHPLDRDNHGGM